MRVVIGTLGVEQVREAIWDWSNPHALLVGATGAGKSYAAGIIIKAASQEAQVLVIDGKGGPDYLDLPSDALALGADESVLLMEEAAAEVDRRMAVMRDRRSRVAGDPPLLVVVDEAAAIQVRQRGDTAAGARDRSERFASSLATVALLGRAADVHLLVLLQRPDVSFVPGAVRDQFTLRICLGYMSPDGLRMIMDANDVEPPPAGLKGHGWIRGAAETAGKPEYLVVGAEPRTRQPPNALLSFFRRAGE